MPYTVEYFHVRVKAKNESWPGGMLGGYARTLELLVEFGPELQMLHSRALGGGLFELRINAGVGSGRAFYCFMPGRRVVVLHAVVESTRRTPAHDLRVARARMKEVLRG
jgi:phage-related protein